MFNGREYPVVDKCGLCFSRGYVMSGIPERVVPRHQIAELVQKMLRKLRGEEPEIPSVPTEGGF
jgi:hypothetical protein